ncbi:hypothetical protein MLD38_022817 [Melastoma candidum]|uniref:Uncharacterized protein n=1 Tax=Melastoma candidum TaxID=119954 RepID=A0ACB9QKE3_9MYRT|nr:hypothetical protein MLD38_022817 [Melastoma candidum]
MPPKIRVLACLWLMMAVSTSNALDATTPRDSSSVNEQTRDCTYPCLLPPQPPSPPASTTICPPPPPPAAIPWTPAWSLPPPPRSWGYYPYFPPPWYVGSAPPPPNPILPYFPWYYKNTLVSQSGPRMGPTTQFLPMLCAWLLLNIVILFL